MRRTEAPITATPRRTGARLLLALALCACGGGADGDADVAKTDTSGAPAAPRAGAPEPIVCDTTPLPDLTPVEGQPWDELVKTISSAGVTFPDSAGNNSIRPVKLCHDCDTVSLQLRAANRTCGLDTLQAQKASHPLAILIPQRDVPARPGLWGAIGKGDTLLMFSPRGGKGAAQVAYRDRSRDPARVTLAPPGSWLFWYCVDEHPAVPERSLWRDRSGRGNGPPGDDDSGGGSYGWMACISGCCQFYTPPPNPEIEDPRDKGRGRGPQSAMAIPDTARPSWCPTPN